MILAPVELDVKQWDAGVGRTLLSAADAAGARAGRSRLDSHGGRREVD